MKQIKLNIISDGDKTAVRTELKKYRIFLKWGLTNTFTNKKKAAIFQARFNEWINCTFYELNFIYADLLYIYRKNWIVIDRDTESKMINSFKTIDANFNKLYRSDYRGSAGSFWALQAIDFICTDILYCLAVLTEWRRNKKDWEQIKDLDYMAKQINYILNEIEKSADPGELGQQIKRRL